MVDERLVRRIGRRIRTADEGFDRAGEDDATLAARQQPRDEAACKLHRYMAIDQQHLGHGRHVVVGGAALESEAGVADEPSDIESGRSVEYTRRGGGRGQIEKREAACGESGGQYV